MDFQISERMEAALGLIREFGDRELVPMETAFLTKPFRSLLPALEKKRAMVRQMGLWAPGHPKELGGMGLDLVDLGLVSEALAGPKHFTSRYVGVCRSIRDAAASKMPGPA